MTYKDLNPQVATFSNDGSLIIAGFESIITVWLSDNHKLKCSLKHPFQNDNIIHLSFGTGTNSHLVFCATSKYVSVWNLLSLSLVWTVRVDVSLAISDIRTPFKAVFTKDKKRKFSTCFLNTIFSICFRSVYIGFEIIKADLFK